MTAELSKSGGRGRSGQGSVSPWQSPIAESEAGRGPPGPARARRGPGQRHPNNCNHHHWHVIFKLAVDSSVTITVTVTVARRRPFSSGLNPSHESSQGRSGWPGGQGPASAGAVTVARASVPLPALASSARGGAGPIGPALQCQCQSIVRAGSTGTVQLSAKACRTAVSGTECMASWAAGSDRRSPDGMAIIGVFMLTRTVPTAAAG